MKSTFGTSALFVLAAAIGCSGSAPAPESEMLGASAAPLTGCDAVDGNNLEFRDDACRKKRLPTNEERTLACPIVSTVAKGFAPSSEKIVVDTTTLAELVPRDLALTVVLIRRVDGIPYYRYLSNGTHDVPFEPWSSTKFMAAAGAGVALRKASAGAKVGLTAKVGAIPLGDLVTVVTSYREDRYTSNGLARYFLNVAGREAVGAFIHTWLGRPLAETYGGNYGMPAPNLGYRFVEASGAQVTIKAVDKDGPPNYLSTLTIAEFLKRLAVSDDVDTRLPGLEAQDLETLFYGAKDSLWYPGELGGMSADPSIYVQHALAMDDVERDAQGRWRIFGKLGFGKGEFVGTNYACLPVLDAKGVPVPDSGAEFVIATRLASGGADFIERDQLIAAIYEKLIQKVILPNAQTRGPTEDSTSEPSVSPGGVGDGPSRPRSPTDESSGCAIHRGTSRQDPPVFLFLALALLATRRRSLRASLAQRGWQR